MSECEREPAVEMFKNAVNVALLMNESPCTWYRMFLLLYIGEIHILIEIQDSVFQYILMCLTWMWEICKLTSGIGTAFYIRY